ncbi:MAG: hypothetical protein KAH91_01825 [Thermoplasmatales archaeon]|nr:hypothetical protein [Thermoplasmatales archaeon]
MTVKKFTVILAVLAIVITCPSTLVLADSNSGEIYEDEVTITYRNVTVYAPAVASTGNGYIGVISTITVKIQSNGSGRVFVDTLPLTQVDMQGSARLAVKVASALVENDEDCDVNPSTYDYFFVVRTSAPIIGGPSAGGIMTVATIALLENWDLSGETVMTGMINPDGSIGPIGGIIHKIDAAYSVGAMHFLIPYGQGTYTEMVSTIETTGGWTRTVAKPVTRNVADYAMDNYGMTITEVADVNEALENFTGYRFFFDDANGEITTDDYLASMEPLSTSLLQDAKDAYYNASIELEAADIPNQYPTYYKDDIEDYLIAAEEKLTQSEESYENETFYTSTSKSFQSLIYSRFVSYACEYWATEEDSFIDDLLQEVQNWHNDASDEAKNAEINGFISLQTVGAAQRRASEAKQYLDSAESMYNSGLNIYSDVLDFLYRLTFVVERSNSIGWWIDIGSYFNETGTLDKDTLDDLALEYIEEAQQATVYSSIILSEMGSTYGDSTDYLSYAEELLETARDDLDKGYPAAALFEALEATVRANLAIEIIGIEPEVKIELASESAINKISKSRQQGIEPVLAVSYYEYAESLTNESEFDSALLYYKYSGMIAGVLSFSNSTLGTSTSRYVGLPTILTISEDWLFTIITATALALILGIGIGLIIGGTTLKDKEEKKFEPKQISGPQKPPRHPYFSKEEMPRSIKDYYKKNK